ncbi:DUF2007 domain-containing protein [Cytophagaceae bacterium ABcell3]|nr:DUF2007 domain-containing protein [Cytophagaceae bacterium ABcell3]
MINWQKVYSTDKHHRAELVKDVLADNQIEAVIINKKDSSYHFGEFEIHVTRDNVIKALKIIEDEIKFE